MRYQFGKQIQLFPKTLVPEFYNIFGEAVTDKLLTVFAGTTICVPSTKDQRNAYRDIRIYEEISAAGSPAETRRTIEELAKQHKISRRHIRKVQKKLKKLFKINTKLREADLATGQHKVKRANVKRKSKLRGM